MFLNTNSLMQACSSISSFDGPPRSTGNCVMKCNGVMVINNEKKIFQNRKFSSRKECRISQ